MRRGANVAYFGPNNKDTDAYELTLSREVPTLGRANRT
jgi:hypothetical protein